MSFNRDLSGISSNNTIAALLFGCILLVISCSSDDSGTNSGSGTAEMTGAVFFPNQSITDHSQYSISFGDEESSLDAGGTFEISGNREIPGLAAVYDSDTIPLLMGIVPDPQPGIQVPSESRRVRHASSRRSAWRGVGA